MDIVTVTASKDNAIFQLHAHSINTFVTTPTTHWVIIEDNAIPELEWIKMLQPIYKRHTLKIIYNPMPDFAHIGWIRQQLFKFTIASRIESAEYVIFDSKNICIKPFDLTVMPEGNKTIASRDQIMGSHWGKWVAYLGDKLQKDVPEMFWSPETPFKVDTSIVNEMLTQIDLKKLFSSGGFDKSEFILYKFFTNGIPTGPDGMNQEGMINRTFWDELPSTEMLDEIINQNVYLASIGLHRAAMMRSPDNLKNILIWLVRKGLNPKYVNLLKLTA